jgi:hypothetical protein
LRVIDSTTKEPAKPRIYEVRVTTYTYNKKGGRKMNYDHLIKYPGWEEFFSREEG